MKRLDYEVGGCCLQMILGLIAGLLIVLSGNSAVLAQTQTVSGSVNVSGVVPGPPPDQAAVILVPKDGQSFTQPNITVSGTCQADTFIQIDRNDGNAGVTDCSTSGTFSIEISLVLGSNRLVARTFDALLQEGPPSAHVTVTYAPAQPGSTGSASSGGIISTVATSGTATPLSLEVGHIQNCLVFLPRIVFAGQLSGGVPPYSGYWRWGDGAVEPISETRAGTIGANHHDIWLAFLG